MKITARDIEIMGWMLEQKFMTREQVRKVFWKDISEKSTEDYRRLYELMKAGFLKRSKYGFYKHVLYMVTANGLRELKSFGRHRGLCELADVDYSHYKHDVAVTDIRIIFNSWGYTDWLSERVLSKLYQLRRLPDGMIYNRGKYVAVEYESSQKSKERYRDIFFDYEMDDHISQVIYIADTPSLVEKLKGEAATCGKLHFLTLQELQTNQMNAHLQGVFEKSSVHELLEIRE